MMVTKDNATQCDHIQTHIAKTLPEMVALRHQFHEWPEIAFQEHQTSGKIAELLEGWGYSVTRGIGKTGVVATLKLGNGKKTIGIRADMDALPITEQTNAPYTSRNLGVMHACGHDGHMAILLTAARYLAETRNFNGQVNLIFQPAEEGPAGAKAMIEDGLFDRFPCDLIYGLHNLPGYGAGTVHFTKGPVMASVDTVYVTIKGKGGHGAHPESAIDPVIAACSTVMALQTIVSRNISPLDTAIVSVGLIQGGTASNVIPNEVKLEITVRAYEPETRQLLEERIVNIIKAQTSSYGAKADIIYEHGYPVTVNEESATFYARDIALTLFKPEDVYDNAPPLTPSEDFSFMLEKCRGCYVILGNGDTAGLHSPHYDFNDDSLLAGATLWAGITEAYLK